MYQSNFKPELSNREERADMNQFPAPINPRVARLVHTAAFTLGAAVGMAFDVVGLATDMGKGVVKKIAETASPERLAEAQVAAQVYAAKLQAAKLAAENRLIAQDPSGIVAQTIAERRIRADLAREQREAIRAIRQGTQERLQDLKDSRSGDAPTTPSNNA